MDSFNRLPNVTKALLIINIGFFGASYIYPELNRLLALFYFESPFYQPHQLISHVFMHSGIAHLLFNMYALVLFGSAVEKILHANRFLLLYFFSALGAFLLHMGIVWYELSGVPADVLIQMQQEGAQVLAENKNYTHAYLGGINLKLNGAAVGASGALMGV